MSFLRYVGASIDQGFATAEEKAAVKARYWESVRVAVKNRPDAVFFTPRTTKGDPRRVQDMSYLLTF
jgi:hypothetical protein